MRAVDCVCSPISYSPSSILKCFTVLNTRLCAAFRDVSQFHSKPARVNVQWGRVRESGGRTRDPERARTRGRTALCCTPIARKRTIAPRTQMLRLACNSPASHSPILKIFMQWEICCKRYVKKKSSETWLMICCVAGVVNN